MLINTKAGERDFNKYGRDNALKAYPEGLQFRIFCCLWAIATLFHMAHSNLFTAQFHYVLLTLAAVYVIFKPTLPGFLLLIVLQLVDVLETMPVTSNHWIFTGFVNITILYALIYTIIKKRSFQVREHELFETFSPVVRIELIILYFYAVFHKMNAGFFAPASSCATDLLKAQHIDAIIPLSPEMYAANAYFTLIVESIIPIFFCFKRTRNLGVVIGLVFHCILSYSSHNAFYDFSSMAFAAYFLFIAPGFSNMLLGLRRKISNQFMNISTQKYSFKKLVFLMSLCIITMVVIFAITKKLDVRSYYLYIFWTGYSLVYICLFVWFMLSKSIEAENKTAPFSFSIPHLSFAILPVVVFLNGLSPYLGLKTENSYAMFSNLRTEGNISNHYIMPTSFQIFDFQKDMVEIVSSSDPRLQLLANENKLMVFFSFKNYVAQVRPERIEYIRNGQNHTFLLSSTDSGEPLLKSNPILKKLLNFRTISKTEPQPCSH
jgi:hypothetical protein